MFTSTPRGGQATPSFRYSLRSQPAALGAGFALVALALTPSVVEACACGCGIFDVGANTAIPSMADSGLTAFLRISYQDQNKNWEGNSSAPAADNTDKEIKTFFYTLGAQYMINHSWGLMVELPILDRAFTSIGDGSAYPDGSQFTSKIGDLGDLEIQGVYSGFSPDMSTGVTFGVKLPTGNYTGPFLEPGPNTTGGLAYDRDTLPGSGSTDLLVGAYHVGSVSADERLDYFAQARYQVALFTRAGATGTYRPGNEVDGALGLTYAFDGGGAFTKVAPVLEVLGSVRGSDGGDAASPNSGYRRVLVAPGIDLRVDKKFKLYANVAIPVVQHVTSAQPGDPAGSGQLVASALYTVQIGYDF